MSLFQAHKRFIQMGTIFGVAPFRITDRRFETSIRTTLMSMFVSCLNIFIIYRMVYKKISRRESYENKPFGYALLFDGVSLLSYSSGCFIVGGVFFSRKKLITHMNLLSDHVIMQKTYEYEHRKIRSFRSIIYGIFGFFFFNLLVSTLYHEHFIQTFDFILTFPLLISSVVTMVQFLIAVEIIYLSYCRIQSELMTEKLTVNKLQQCSLLDILLKDYANVVEIAYGTFNFVYISLSFLYVLTIELYLAEGGPTFGKAIRSYITALPPLMLFVWFIWRCTLITREVILFPRKVFLVIFCFLG